MVEGRGDRWRVFRHAVVTLELTLDSVHDRSGDVASVGVSESVVHLQAVAGYVQEVVCHGCFLSVYGCGVYYTCVSVCRTRFDLVGGGLHPHPRIKCGAGSSPLPQGRGGTWLLELAPTRLVQALCVSLRLRRTASQGSMPAGELS